MYCFKLHLVLPIGDFDVARYVVARWGQGMPRSDFHQRVRVASPRAEAASVVLTRCAIQMRAPLLERMQVLALPRVFTFLIWAERAGRWHYKVSQMLNQHAQSPTTAPLSGVTRRSANAGTFLQSLICLYFLFISLSCDRYLHQS